MAQVLEIYWHTNGGHLGPRVLTDYSAAFVEAVDQVARGDQWDTEQKAKT